MNNWQNITRPHFRRVFCAGRILAGLGLLLLLQAAPLQAHDEELLPPEQAFSLSAWVDGDQLVAEYRIAPGYYLYRERFDFSIETSDTPASFGAAQMPPGKHKMDQFFGDIETYRERVTIRLPIRFADAAASHLQVKAISQGCADIGVCYPPLKQALDVWKDVTFDYTSTDTPDFVPTPSVTA